MMLGSRLLVRARAMESLISRPVGLSLCLRRLSSSMSERDDVHILSLKMPSILDSTEGRVTKWLRREGESVSAGMGICRVQLEDMEIEMESPFHGVMTDILVKEYLTVPHEAELCVLCDSQDSYMTYFERRRMAALEAERDSNRAQSLESVIKEEDADGNGDANDKEMEATLSGSSTSAHQKALVEDCLRRLRECEKGNRWIGTAAELQQVVRLTRQGNSELLFLFSASIDGDDRKGHFDEDWFLKQALDMIREK